MSEAARGGQLAILQTLERLTNALLESNGRRASWRRRRTEVIDTSCSGCCHSFFFFCVLKASQCGQVRVLQWLITYVEDGHVDVHQTMFLAAEPSNVNVIEWLFKH